MLKFEKKSTKKIVASKLYDCFTQRSIFSLDCNDIVSDGAFLPIFMNLRYSFDSSKKYKVI